eukprot:37255_1
MNETETGRTLTVHLNDELVQLNADQMLQIMKIITSTNRSLIYKDTDDSNEDRIQSEYVLDVNNTFLHSMFEDTNAKRIKQIVDHKLMLISLQILAIIGVIFRFILGIHSAIFNIYTITILCLWIVWLIFKHLLFNKVAFKLCLQSFDFWIKVCYGAMLSVATLFHGTPHVNIEFTLNHLMDCVGMIFNALIISYVSSFDAVHSTKTMKVIVSVCMASFLSIMAIDLQFLMKDEDDYKIEMELSDGVNIISTQSLMARSCQIIALFYWKQSYNVWKSKGRAVTISMGPKITWITATEQLQNAGTTTCNLDDVQSCKQNVSKIDLPCVPHVQNDGNCQESSESANRTSTVSCSH